MKKIVGFVMLGLIGNVAFANDMSNAVGEKVDAASKASQSATDKTAIPVETKTKSMGMDKVSNKVGEGAGTVKNKTTHGAKKIKSAVGATETKAPEVKSVSTEAKTDAMSEADKVIHKEAK